jgi:hypothetical protein
MRFEEETAIAKRFGGRGKPLYLGFGGLPFTPEELLERVRQKSPEGLVWSASGQPVTGAVYMGGGANSFRRQYFASIPGSPWQRDIHDEKNISFEDLHEIWRWAGK